MRFLTIALPVFALVGNLIAQPANPPAHPGMSPREVALDNLLSERESVKALDQVIAEAKKNGISDQSILEARFLFHVDRREDEAIAALLPEFIKQRELFKIEDSAIFSVKEDWLAVIEYVQAIDSLKKNDKAAFKSHITEAFWLSPRQASAFAPHIDRMRLEENMRSVKIDFETKLLALGNGDAIALKTLVPERKAMILHFWSPANSESQASLPDYVVTAKELGEAGIAMVTILPEDSPKILTDAREMIKPLGANPPGAWLLDQKENPLAVSLRIQALPTFVLVSNEGKILFNGEPDDDAFWESLQKLDPKIIRPDITGDGEE
ncbi:MAG: hypothetical protein V4689_01210 [Verrucomicrobiota bacterium]